MPAARRCWPSTSPPASTASPARPAGGVAAGRPHRHLRRPQARPAARRRAPSLAGEVEVADIGLDVSGAARPPGRGRRRGRAGCPPRPVDAHKWQAAVWVVAGSPGMTGAAHLRRPGGASGPAPATCGCPRPGVDDDPRRPTEAVGTAAAGRRLGPGRARRRSTAFGPWSSGPGLGAGDGDADRDRARASPTRRCRSWSTATASPPWAPTPAPVAARPRASDGPHPARRRVRPPGRATARRRPARGGPRPGRATGARRPAEGPDHRGGRARRSGAASRPPATPGWPPPAPATCSPA